MSSYAGYIVLIASIFGLLMLGYGVYCLFAEEAYPSLRGYGPRMLKGTDATLYGYCLLFSGSVMVLAGVLAAFGFPRAIFEVGCFIGGLTAFVAHTVGFFRGSDLT
jgi:hypothetical protein